VMHHVRLPDFRRTWRKARFVPIEPPSRGGVRHESLDS
jgi:hypothetical protein